MNNIVFGRECPWYAMIPERGVRALKTLKLPSDYLDPLVLIEEKTQIIIVGIIDAVVFERDIKRKYIIAITPCHGKVFIDSSWFADSYEMSINTSNYINAIE